MKVHDQYKILQKFHVSQHQHIDMGVSKVNPSEVVLVNAIDKNGPITAPIFDTLIRNLSNVTKYYNEDKYTLVTQYNEGMPLISYAQNYPLEQGKGITLLLELLNKISDYDNLPKDIINVLLKPDQIIVNNEEIALNEILNLDELTSAPDFHEQLKTIALHLLKNESDDLRAFFSDGAFNDEDSLKSIYKHFRARCPKRGQSVDFDEQEHYSPSTSDSILFAPPVLNSDDDSAVTTDDDSLLQADLPNDNAGDMANIDDRLFTGDDLPNSNVHGEQADDDMSILFKNATIDPDQDEPSSEPQQAPAPTEPSFWGLPSFFNKASQEPEEDLIATNQDETLFDDNQVEVPAEDTTKIADDSLQNVAPNPQKGTAKLTLNHDDASMTIPIDDLADQTSGKNTISASINDYIAGGATITLEMIDDDQRIIEKTFTLIEKPKAATHTTAKRAVQSGVNDENKPAKSAVLTHFISDWLSDLSKPSFRRALLVLLLGLIVILTYACNHIHRASTMQG